MTQIRVAYGETLAELGVREPRLVVIDADMAPGTMTCLFRDKHPSRFFDVGIAEQNLVNVGVGLALGGQIPFVNTFAYLLALRAAEQVRSCICYARTNVKIGAGYGGVSGAMDGASHAAVTDLAVVRAFPNLIVTSLSDGVSTRAATLAAAAYDGPVYLRLSRADVPDIHPPDFEFRFGRGVTLREGNDVTIVGTGPLLGRCLKAVDALAGRGIHARLIEIHTLKPLDVELLARAAAETGALVTVEEHSIIGGLGAAVCEGLAETRPAPVVRVGFRDVFPETGPWEVLLDKFGMGVEDIVAAADRAIALRRQGADAGLRR